MHIIIYIFRGEKRECARHGESDHTMIIIVIITIFYFVSFIFNVYSIWLRWEKLHAYNNNNHSIFIIIINGIMELKWAKYSTNTGIYEEVKQPQCECSMQLEFTIIENF